MIPEINLRLAQDRAEQLRREAEAHRRARELAGEPVRVLTGQCLELGEEGLPFAPFAAALRELVRREGGAVLAGRESDFARLLPELGCPASTPGCTRATPRRSRPTRGSSRPVARPPRSRTTGTPPTTIRGPWSVRNTRPTSCSASATSTCWRRPRSW